MKSRESRVESRGHAFLCVLLCAVCLVGCSGLEKIPAGSQLQSSTFGLRLAPQAPDGAPLVLGSHSTIITTAQPQDAGPNLNRFEAQAPFTTIKSTVASGPVGEELRAAGGESAIRALVTPDDSPPAPEPRDWRVPTGSGSSRTPSTAAERGGSLP